MMSVLAWFAAGLFAITWVAGFLCWFSAVFFMIAMAASRSPEAKQPPSTKWNPFNLVFFPDYLTESGNKHRRRFLWSIGGFCASIALGFTLGGLVDLVRHIGQRH
jgi:hypothetical protein